MYSKAESMNISLQGARFICMAVCPLLYCTCIIIMPHALVMLSLGAKRK